MGKEKLARALEMKLQNGKKVFSPFIMAGDGGLDILEERINFLEENGAAVIELGIPFSDPVADGPSVQAAGIRSLKNGTTLRKVLALLEKGKNERTIPIVIMTYYNPVYIYGLAAFAESCHHAGVDGVIIPDLSLEEETALATELKRHEIAFVRLAAMTSPEARLAEIAKRSEGFLYAVAVKGTTGARANHDENVTTYLDTLKKYSNVPVFAGFGVSSPEQAHKLGKHCDGVIVGSKIVDLLHQGKTEEVAHFMKESLQVEQSMK